MILMPNAPWRIAWLIARFIDKAPTFVWLADPKKCPKSALGYDFDGATFTNAPNTGVIFVSLAPFAERAHTGLAKDAILNDLRQQMAQIKEFINAKVNLIIVSPHREHAHFFQQCVIPRRTQHSHIARVYLARNRIRSRFLAPTDALSGYAVPGQHSR